MSINVSTEKQISPKHPYTGFLCPSLWTPCCRIPTNLISQEKSLKKGDSRSTCSWKFNTKFTHAGWTAGQIWILRLIVEILGNTSLRINFLFQKTKFHSWRWHIEINPQQIHCWYSLTKNIQNTAAFMDTVTLTDYSGDKMLENSKESIQEILKKLSNQLTKTHHLLLVCSRGVFLSNLC